MHSTAITPLVYREIDSQTNDHGMFRRRTLWLVNPSRSRTVRCKSSVWPKPPPCPNQPAFPILRRSGDFGIVKLAPRQPMPSSTHLRDSSEATSALTPPEA